MAFQDKVINGTEILLYVGDDVAPLTADNVVGCATSHSIEITNSVREVACKSSGLWQSSEYGRFTWTVSVDALVNLSTVAGESHYQELLALMMNQTIIQMSSQYDEDTDGDGTPDGTQNYDLTGNVMITSLSKNASDAENASFSVQLQGVGPLVQTVAPTP